MEEIYKEYSKYIFNYLSSFTNAEIAEELMQETFYSAMKNIHKFKNNSCLKTWLYKIAKNKLIDYYKKTNKMQEINLDNVNERLMISNSFEEDCIDRDELINVYKKIHKLDEKSKEVVLLRIKCEFNFKEIGDIIGKTEEWARITFYRAKVKLKEDFENE